KELLHSEPFESDNATPIAARHTFPRVRAETVNGANFRERTAAVGCPGEFHGSVGWRLHGEGHRLRQRASPGRTAVVSTEKDSRNPSWVDKPGAVRWLEARENPAPSGDWSRRRRRGGSCRVAQASAQSRENWFFVRR